jgi:hypothetical protein
LSGAFAERSHAVVLLGCIHQLEVRGERTDHILRTSWVERVDQRNDGSPPRSARPSAERDRGRAKSLDVGEQLRPSTLGYRVAE